MSRARDRVRRRLGFARVAFWQWMSFVIMLLVIWVDEILDLSSLWFGTPPHEPEVFRGFALTIGTLVTAIITVGYTYVLQKRIISGLLTVCSHCRKIRVGADMWEQLDEFISEHSLASISHGICPHCYDEMQREVQRMSEKENAAPNTTQSATSARP